MVIKELLRELNRIKRPAAGQDRGLAVRAAWFVVNVAVVHNRLNPLSSLRALALKLFGAEIGHGVVLRPGLRVKFPWKLRIGDEACLGEDAWIDNIETVTIGSNAVISQGAYLCTGNHDWTKRDMPLTAKPINIGERAWVGARVVIGPGVTVGKNALVRLGSVATRDVPAISDGERGV